MLIYHVQRELTTSITTSLSRAMSFSILMRVSTKSLNIECAFDRKNNQKGWLCLLEQSEFPFW